MGDNRLVSAALDRAQDARIVSSTVPWFRDYAAARLAAAIRHVLLRAVEPEAARQLVSACALDPRAPGCAHGPTA